MNPPHYAPPRISNLPEGLYGILYDPEMSSYWCLLYRDAIPIPANDPKEKDERVDHHE